MEGAHHAEEKTLFKMLYTHSMERYFNVFICEPFRTLSGRVRTPRCVCYNIHISALLIEGIAQSSAKPVWIPHVLVCLCYSKNEVLANMKWMDFASVPINLEQKK